MADITKLKMFSDEDLEEIDMRGDNLNIPSSEAATAQRILEQRLREKQRNAAANMEKVTGQLVESNKGMTGILHFVEGLVKLLDKPFWTKVSAFLLVTVGLGLLINLAASYIAKFWLNW